MKRYNKHMPQTESAIDRLTIRDFWHASLRHKRQFLPALLVPVANLGISVGVPYMVGRLLGSLTQPKLAIHGYVTWLIIISAISVILNYISFKNLFALQPLVMSELQEKALTALMKRGTSFHNSRVSGKLVSDAIDYPTAYLQLNNTFLIDIISFLLVVLFGIVLVALHSWVIGLVLFGMAVMSIGSAIRFRRQMAPHRTLRKEAGKEVTAHIADTIVNNVTVKTFGNEAHELQRHRKLAMVLEKIRARDWYLLALDGTYRNLALLIFQLVFILIAIAQVHRNPSLLGTSIFAFSYTITISNRLFQIGTMMRSVEDSLLLASPMTELLQESPEVNDALDANELRVDRGTVTFEDVSFHYADASVQSDVFHGLNLHIAYGEKIGLVGHSGGGKSTLTRLLLRFEDIQSGQITIDDQNIATVTQASLRRNIAYVPQEPLLFHRTISENIAYGNLSASEKDIVEAAGQAFANDFIEALPNGYQTIVGERGVKLSGGQRQRIAIARAILKDAPILVLDEATSALDSESEKVIQQALWELMEHKTTIVVAHRLSTIQRLDRIIVLDDGKIVEDGSHSELLKQGGLYAKLWAHQSGGFIED